MINFYNTDNNIKLSKSAYKQTHKVCKKCGVKLSLLHGNSTVCKSCKVRGNKKLQTLSDAKEIMVEEITQEIR